MKLSSIIAIGYSIIQGIEGEYLVNGVCAAQPNHEETAVKRALMAGSGRFRSAVVLPKIEIRERREGSDRVRCRGS